jgi:transcriptional regulator with XRE-family HTH domain
MKKLRTAEVAKSIGKSIAEHRQAAGLTQEEVAEKLEIGHEAVSRMERGLIVPTVARLIELAEIFNCDVTTLLLQSSDRPSDQAQFIAKQLERLSAPDRELVINISASLTRRLSTV